MHWWASYSWSKVTDRVDNEDVSRGWDQTHAVSAGVDWDTPKWNASFALAYRSGWPTSEVALDNSGETPVVIVLERNGDRMDVYRSLDVRLARKIELARSSLALSFELTNMLGHRNPCCVEYEIGDENDDGSLVLDPLDYLPRIPSIGVLWKF
jgi:hypothetical protein